MPRAKRAEAECYSRLARSWPGLTRAYPPDRDSGDTEPARMEVRHGTNVHSRFELLLHGEGTGFSLEHVTRIHPQNVRERTGKPHLSDAGDRSADISERSDTGEGRPSCTEPDYGSCSSDTPRLRALNAGTLSGGGHSPSDTKSRPFVNFWLPLISAKLESRRNEAPPLAVRREVFHRAAREK